MNAQLSQLLWHFRFATRGHGEVTLWGIYLAFQLLNAPRFISELPTLPVPWHWRLGVQRFCPFSWAQYVRNASITSGTNILLDWFKMERSKVKVTQDFTGHELGIQRLHKLADKQRVVPHVGELNQSWNQSKIVSFLRGSQLRVCFLLRLYVCDFWATSIRFAWSDVSAKIKCTIQWRWQTLLLFFTLFILKLKMILLFKTSRDD